ncbi:MAG: CrcB family protein [Acidobacteria bacterium]|nr:CrcB family protein [Acidobacteriota bacterium]
MNLLLVSIAGALGCILRYVLEYLARSRHPTSRPWATVAANALGCGVAGWATYRLTGALDANLRAVVITGFCGGLTTFSSAFAIPAVLAREHHVKYSIALVAMTPVLCIVAFVVGVHLGH